MSIVELSQLHSLLNGAVIPESVFSSLRSGLSAPLPERIEALEQEYLLLTRIADPQLFAGNSFAQQMARRVMTLLYELHEEAMRSLEGERSSASPTSSVGDSNLDGNESAALGRAQSPPQGSAPDSQAAEARFTIKTAKGTYEAEGLLATGDLSTVFRGFSLAVSNIGAPATGSNLATGSKLAIKVAFEPADNDLLQNEVRTLRLFEAIESPQRKHLPQLVDQFQTPDGRAGTVLQFIEGFDLAAIHARYPQGLLPEHGIWIFRRLLSAVGFAHQQGVIHGNIEPAHILVQPTDHNVVLIDWSYSIAAPLRSGQGFRAHNPDYSPPEVSERKPPIPASDLYSVGKCMIKLLGGDIERDTLPAAVDERLARFIQFFVRPSSRQRAQDAWEMYGKLSELRQEIYGAHRFLALEM